MRSNSVYLKTFVAAGVVALSAGTMSSPSWARKASMSAIDTNHDGSISLDEAHAAAEKKFARLDKAHTGKIKSPMSMAINEEKNTQKGLMIDKTEYMAGVDAAFQEADGDKDGKLEPSELKTPAGKKFLADVE